LTAQVANNAVSGGNKRGTRAVDWQTNRSSATNVASGNFSTIVGGSSNTASGISSTAMGVGNTASGISSTAMGVGTTASGNSSTAMGELTTASGFKSTAIGNGTTASGSGSTAMGNVTTASGIASTAIGYGVTVSGDHSFGFHADNMTGTTPMSISTPNVAVFGNADLWLANTDNSASELRLYEAQSTTGAFPAASTNYTAFKSGTQSANITYTLPTAAPTSNGQVLSSTTGGLMSWASPGLTLPFSGSSSSSSAALSISTTGTGGAAEFSSSNSTFAVLSASTTAASSRVAFFQNNNASNGSEAVLVLSNAAVPACSTASTGSGAALEARGLGTGSAATISINNSGSSANALVVSTNGTGNAISATGAVNVTGNIAASGAVTIGSGSAAITKVLTATSSLDFPSTSAGTSDDETIAVTGADLGDVVFIGVPHGSVITNTNYTAWVSGEDQVTIRFNNYSGSSADPSSGTFRVTVMKF
jgi:hypothetical protein